LVGHGAGILPRRYQPAVRARPSPVVVWAIFLGTITNLSGATVTATTLDCALGTTIDQVEELVAGSSGLQNQGNGNYQLNWQSPKSYAGSCKTLHLNVHDGVTHDAFFQFTK
jgi:hypothetical protein